MHRIYPNKDQNSLNKFNQYMVQRGDSLYKIANEYQTDMKTLRLINGLEFDDYLYPGQKILVPKSNIGVYSVTENETIHEVLEKMNIDLNNLMENNMTIYLLPEQLLFFKKGKSS